MTKTQIKRLIDRYLKGQTSKQESNLMDEFYTRATQEGTVPENWDDDKKSRIKKRMYQKIEHKTQRSKGFNTRYALSAAAAAIALLISGYFYFNSSSGTIPISEPESSSVSITATEEQRSILLSDGSYVLLNPGATLSYPKEFEGQYRKVELTGEAWFDINRDTLHPFQVVTNEVTTTVLGTSFTINANAENSKVEVKVTSGKVKVSTKDQDLAVLETNDHLQYESGEYKIVQNKPLNGHSVEIRKPENWKLANVTMAEAAVFLEKRWQKSFTFENQRIRECLLYASFNAEDPLEEVLMIICGVTNSNYAMEDDKIKIYGPGCNPKEQ